MYGIGTDIVEIPRIKPWSNDKTTLEFVFTQKEIADAFKKKVPHKHLASIFATKEAFMKAIGTGWGNGVGWKDIEVHIDKRTISIKLYNKAKALCCGKKVFVDTSCTNTSAIATVLIS